MVALTGHWIGRGWSNDEILTTAGAMTLPGYAIDQTRAAVSKMIKGGRVKWNAHNPEHTVHEQDGSADFMPAPGWDFDFKKFERRCVVTGAAGRCEYSTECAPAMPIVISAEEMTPTSARGFASASAASVSTAPWRRRS